jgi:transcriptional regulator with XRE-family HTH domain
VKTEARLAARRLRAEGWSVKEIERELGVARSSASMWVRDVAIDPEARARLAQRVHIGIRVSAERRASAARSLRLSYHERGRHLIYEHDATYAAGCALYWAEGAKGRNSVKLTNSDPEMLAYFIAFLREYFEASNDRVKLHCNLFADHLPRQREIEDYWLRRPSSAGHRFESQP